MDEETLESPLLDRFQDNLERQKENLLDWLQRTPPEKKRIHLGPAGEESARAHLEVLEETIVRAEEKSLGRCAVCQGLVEPGHLEIDYTTSVCLDHYSDEEKRQLELDLELSQKLQKALLPQRLPEIPGLQIAAFSQPAQIVGGDYFDFFCFADGSHGLVIADVMGKGMPASMLMASLQASLRLIGPESRTPVEVITRINRLFCHNIHLTKFVTLFLGRFQPGSRSLLYVNAGHNPALLHRADGPEWLRPTGAAIGLTEGASYGMRSVSFGPDDLLVLYTDGLTEAANQSGEEFGTGRLALHAGALAPLPAADQLKRLRDEVQRFTGARAFADDLTLLVVRHL